nr:hypothetical protein CFP56_38847 [Quercus suber]
MAHRSVGIRSISPTVLQRPLLHCTRLQRRDLSDQSHVAATYCRLGEEKRQAVLALFTNPKPIPASSLYLVRSLVSYIPPTSSHFSPPECSAMRKLAVDHLRCRAQSPVMGGGEPSSPQG